MSDQFDKRAAELADYCRYCAEVCDTRNSLRAQLTEARAMRKKAEFWAKLFNDYSNVGKQDIIELSKGAYPQVNWKDADWIEAEKK